MIKKIGDHHYVESGLDNVMLQKVPKYRCKKCGAERVIIGAIGPLHRAIARSLAEKPARLLPQEVRFLRDHLELSNKEFAALMGVSPEQASRWASLTNSDPIGVPAEHLLRLLATLGPEQLAHRKSRSSASKKKTSLDALLDVLDHLPPSSTPARPVGIGLRRKGEGDWQTRALPN